MKGLVAGIKESGIECDAIAFRGMSGALVGPMVALELGKEFIMVRKRNANSHSSYMVEGNTRLIDNFEI